MGKVLTNPHATSNDVLKVRHRTSEPFDHPIAPADLPTIIFDCGEVAAINASGYAVRGSHANLAAITVVGLFMLPSQPSDVRKNNYVQSSGNASIISSGIVVLDRQITDAAITARDPLYMGTDGKITKTDPGSGKKIGWAMSSRTAAGAEVIVKLEL